MSVFSAKVIKKNNIYPMRVCLDKYNLNYSWEIVNFAT